MQTPEYTATKEQKEYMHRDDEVRCPKCHSNQINVGKKGFSLAKAATGFVLVGPLGLLGGILGSGRIKVTCLKCGTSFCVN